MGNSIEILVGWLTAARETYKDDYLKAIQERKTAEKELNDNYVKNTPLYATRQREIKDEFEQKLTEARTAAADLCTPHLTALKEDEFRKVQRIDETKLRKVSMLKDLSVSTDEMIALVEKYNPDDDYWTGRALAEIAEKNGIDPRKAGIQVPFDVKVGIIDSLTNQLTELLIQWNPEQKHNYENEVLLSPNVLDRAIDLYTNGNNEQEYKTANMAYMKIKSGGSQVERGLLFRNIMRNVTGETKNELFYLISQDQDFTDLTLQMSGYAEEVADWKSGKAKNYAKALRTLGDIVKIKDSEVVKQSIEQNRDNEFFMNLLKQESRKNPIIQKALYPEDDTVQNDSNVSNEVGA